MIRNANSETVIISIHIAITLYNILYSIVILYNSINTVNYKINKFSHIIYIISKRKILILMKLEYAMCNEVMDRIIFFLFLIKNEIKRIQHACFYY